MQNYWLLKSEPDCYSWNQMKEDGTTHWDGVRNFQARNYMKEMKSGDLAFFYHSGPERRIVGIVEVSREYYPDHTDPTNRFGMVDVTYSRNLDTPVTLKAIKLNPNLQNIALVKHSRLSVMPLSKADWNEILGCVTTS